MLTSWKVFIRDFGRLLRAPKVWIIVIGVMVTPALYSWFNIAAFWDPYGNTENIQVAVVNEDKGASSDLTGKLDVGGQLVSQLQENHQLGWRFLSAEDADDALKKGDVFATVTVPSEFSQDFVSMFEGTYQQPALQYQVNEKLNAIAPKITDQGATTLDAAISTTFKEKLAQSVAVELKNSGGELSTRLNTTSGKAADAFSETADTVASSRGQLSDVQTKIQSARPAFEEAKQALGSVSTTLDDAQIALNQVEDLTADVTRQITDFTDVATDAYVQGTGALAEGAASANATVNSVSGQLRGALSRIDAASSGARSVSEQAGDAIASLQSIANNPALPVEATAPLKQATGDLQNRNEQNQGVLDQLEALSDDADSTLDSLNATTQALEGATVQTQDSSKDLSDSVGTTVPALTSAINQVSATAGQLSASLGAQKSLVDQSGGLLDGVDKQLGNADGVISSLGNDLASIEDSLRTARTDVLALNRAANDEDFLNTIKGLDAPQISRFLASPAEMKSHAVFPVEHYGSGMASLFTNLSLWIGAFILMIIFRTEVDTAGVSNLTVTKAYLGRYLLLGFLATCQALIVSIGNLVLGVQTVNPVGFVANCVLISLCYLSIIFGLVSTFGHVGRGITVVLAFIQIPGASGLYPIEMTPDFFRAIFPWLPFTYGIGAMRETVGGFYADQYWQNTATLIGMAALAFIVGTLLRRRLSHVNMMASEELAAGGLIINEQVHIMGSRYRLADLIFALRNREGFQKNVESKWGPFRHRYSTFMGLTVGTGLAAIGVFVVLSRINPDEKAIFFGLSCLVTLIAMGVICMLEYLKQSLRRAGAISALSSTELERHLSQQSHNPNAYQLEETCENSGGFEGSQDSEGEK